MFRFILMSVCFVFLLSANSILAQDMSKEQKKIWEKRQKSMSVEEFKKKIEGYETASDEATRLNRQFISLSQSLAEKKLQIDSLEKALANYQQGNEIVATSSKSQDTNSDTKKSNIKSSDTKKTNTKISNSNKVAAENPIIQTETTQTETTQTASTQNENVEKSNVVSNFDASSSSEDDYSKGTIYRVQVGAFRNKDLMKFVGHKRFHAEQDQDGVKKYTLAAFRDYWEADLFKKYMREMGVKDAWIVGYKDGVRVQIESVLSAEDQSIVKAGDSKNNDVD